MRRLKLSPVERFRIRMMLTACGLTQEKAARAIGLSPERFSQQLSGEATISEEHVRRLTALIAEAFRESGEELYREFATSKVG